MTQTEAILAWLEQGHELTPLDALEHFGCFRLAARIEELRVMGYAIGTRMVKHGNKRYAVYQMLLPDQRELFSESGG